MVISCSAYGCTNRQSKKDNLSFHRFPKNPELRNKWVTATRRDQFTPSQWASLCSLHFLDSDYYINVFGNKRLKSDAIPSIFNFSLKVNKVRRKWNTEQKEFRQKILKPLETNAEASEHGQDSNSKEAKRNFLESVSLQPAKVDDKDETPDQEKPTNNVFNINSDSFELNVGDSAVLLIVDEDQQTINVHNVVVPENLERRLQIADNSNPVQNNPIPVQRKSQTMLLKSRPCDCVSKGSVITTKNLPQTDSTIRIPTITTDSDIDSKDFKSNSQTIVSNGNISNTVKNLITSKICDDKNEFDVNKDNQTVNLGHSVLASSDINYFLDVKCVCGLKHIPQDYKLGQQITEENVLKSNINECKKRLRQPTYFGDFIVTDMQCPVRRNRYWDVTQKLVSQQRKSIKYYSKKARKLQATVNNLKAIINKIF